MKRFFSIFLLVLPAALFWSACEDNEDVLPDQQNRIRQYLRSNHVPKLLSETEKEESLDENPAFYTVAGDTVYRYIRNYYDAERADRAEVEYGDSVVLTFRMYVFDYTNIVETGKEITMPYYSNDKTLEQSYYNTGLTPGAWSFEPLRIELGRTQILRGLELALPGCRARDTVETYMTYNMAYGEDPLGVIPKQSPVAVFFTDDEVEKQ